MQNNKKDITPYNLNVEAHGEWIMYYDNGQLWYNGEYKDSYPHGEWFVYFIDGRLNHKGEYINGNRVGMWKEWNFATEEYDNIFYG